MTACPAGHDSVATDYCDVCGMRMEIPAGQATAAQAQGAQSQAAQSQAAQSQAAQVTAPHVTAPLPLAQPGQLCPRCGATRSGRFCEGCGLDLDAPMPPAHGTSGDRAEITPGPGAGWSVVASADRAYYDTVTGSGGPDAALVAFPAYCPERRFALTGQEMRIGRRSASRGLMPEIDLTGPPVPPWPAGMSIRMPHTSQ